MYNANQVNYAQATPSAGISQPSGIQPKKVIKIFGQEFVLCKDASDPTTSFPHNRVKIQAGDCVHIKDADLDVYFCYLHGFIPPLPNSLEKPVNDYYVGFHKNHIDIRFLTNSDLNRMNIYRSETTDWATSFAKNLLGFPISEEQEREPISPFPPGWPPIQVDEQTQKHKKKKVVNPQEDISVEEVAKENLNEQFRT